MHWQPVLPALCRGFLAFERKMDCFKDGWFVRLPRKDASGLNQSQNMVMYHSMSCFGNDYEAQSLKTTGAAGFT